MTLALYLAFIAVTSVFCATPGPAVLLVSSQAMARGFADGVRAAVGVQLAASFFWLVSALGLTALVTASEQTFTIVKYAGAIYLIAVGALAIRHARRNAASPHGAARSAPWRDPLIQGAIGNLANPKAILFYIALLPQFVTPGPHSAGTFALLWATACTIDFGLLSLYAWTAAKGRTVFRDRGPALWRERLAGAVQIAIGGFLWTLKRAA